MTHDELTDAVHKTLVNAYQMGYECGPGDVMIDIAAGEELATVIVNKVRAAEQRRIRAALRNDASVAELVAEALYWQQVDLEDADGWESLGETFDCTLNRVGKDAYRIEAELALRAALAAIGLGEEVE